MIMLMSMKEEYKPILLALAAVAIALGITNILLAYNIATEMNQSDRSDVNNIHAELDYLKNRYDAIDKKVENIDSKLIELKGINEVLNDIRYKLVNINSIDEDSNSNSNALKYMLDHSLEQRLKGLEGNVEDRGDFKLMYIDDKHFSRILSRSKVIDAYIDALNSKFILPHDIEVVVDDDDRCKNASGYYEQMRKRIVLCYSSIDNFMRLYPDDVGRFSILVKFLLYHEVAHALIDAYKLPIVGMQEYAADNFAIVMMLNDGDDIHPLIWLYDAMREDKYATSTTSIRYWDTHMLFVQRYYDILCLAYGSDPLRYDSSSNDLPSERAYRCSHEYSSTLNAWNELLKPWMKVS